MSLALLLCSRRDRMAACNTLMSPEGRVSAMMTVRKAGMSLRNRSEWRCCSIEQQKHVPVAMPLSRKNPLIWRIKFMLPLKPFTNFPKICTVDCDAWQVSAPSLKSLTQHSAFVADPQCSDGMYQYRGVMVQYINTGF